MKNQKGSILLISVLVIAAISIVVVTMMFSRSQDLAKTGRSYQRQLENAHLAHEMKVIFANPKLCEDVVQISGNTFQLIDILQVTPGTLKPVSANAQVAVKEMKVENVTNVAGGLRESDFTIVTQEINDKDGRTAHANTVRVRYRQDPVSGLVTDCRVSVNAQQACLELGYTWNALQSRCEICEKMGGIYNSSSACVLPGAGS